MLSTRLLALVALVLAANAVAKPHVAVPKTLMVKRAIEGEIPSTSPSDDGTCPDDGVSCNETSCCPSDMQCDAADAEETSFTCIPYSDDFDPPEGTEPTPETNGSCADGQEQCPSGGCCATTCLAADAEGTKYVCEISDSSMSTTTTMTSGSTTMPNGGGSSTRTTTSRGATGTGGTGTNPGTGTGSNGGSGSNGSNGSGSTTTPGGGAAHLGATSSVAMAAAAVIVAFTV